MFNKLLLCNIKMLNMPPYITFENTWCMPVLYKLGERMFRLANCPYFLPSPLESSLKDSDATKSAATLSTGRNDTSWTERRAPADKQPEQPNYNSHRRSVNRKYVSEWGKSPWEPLGGLWVSMETQQNRHGHLGYSTRAVLSSPSELATHKTSHFTFLSKSSENPNHSSACFKDEQLTSSPRQKQ